MLPQDQPSVFKSSDELAGVYDRAAATYGRTGPSFMAHFGRRLADLAAIEPGMAVLDVGTGTGAALLPAAALAGSQGRAVGIDISAGMLQAARHAANQAGLAHVELLRMPAEALEFADHSFDRVLCGLSIHHFSRRERALAEFHRVTRPGGRLTISTLGPAISDWLAQVVDWLRPYWPAQAPAPRPGRGRLCEPEYLARLLQEAGFTDARMLVEAIDLVFGSTEEWWAWLLSTGPRAAIETVERGSGPAALRAARRDCFTWLEQFRRADGYHLPGDVLFGLAARPAAGTAGRDLTPGTS